MTAKLAADAATPDAFTHELGLSTAKEAICPRKLTAITATRDPCAR